MKKITSVELRTVGHKYIDQNEFLPDFIKKNLRILWGGTVSNFNNFLGTVELTYRRTYQHADEIRKEEHEKALKRVKSKELI